MPPNGGPKDTKAPQFVNKSTADSVLNFSGGNIVLEFDEYIKLANVQQNFTISPLTQKRPKIKAKKKKLIIELPDSLLESNTTYTLDFGNAVQDIKESNAYKNLRITLSTGSYFDSLQLKGKIFDASTGRGDSIRVLLYPDDMPDSMLLKQRPLYVSKAGNGMFSFSGLPNKKFKIAALGDKNSNYIYDARGEKIAFYDRIIDIVNPDSALVLYSFVEDKMIDSSGLIKSAQGGGKGKNAKNKQGAPLSYVLNPNIKAEKKFDRRDTLRIEILDTNAQVNTAKLRFYENEALDLSVELEYDDSNKVITVLPEWQKGTKHRLIVGKNFLTDTSGNGSKADTLEFTTFSDEDYAGITVVLDSALYKPGAIIMVYDKETLVRKAKATLTPVSFNELKPKTYKLRLLYDENANGKWDSGELENRKQPEITLELPKSIRLKPNWEENVEWKFGTKKGKIGKKK